MAQSGRKPITSLLQDPPEWVTDPLSHITWAADGTPPTSCGAEAPDGIRQGAEQLVEVGPRIRVQKEEKVEDGSLGRRSQGPEE